MIIYIFLQLLQDNVMRLELCAATPLFAHVLHSCLPSQIGLKVASLQEQSTAQRKKLADATRDFKRSSSSSPADSEVVKAAGQLLKQYQEEIDALTRRSAHMFCQMLASAAPAEQVTHIVIEQQP